MGWVQIIGTAEACFANNASFSTQLGNMLLLTDNFAIENPIDDSSYRSQRVVRSVIGGDLYAISDAVELALLLERHIDSVMSGQSLVAFLVTPAVIAIV